jgi:3-phenylpropionate/trans-cinnamate dioxygenase ferredoxin subunit
MSWQRVCKLDQIAIGGLFRSVIDDERVVVCRTGERELYAIEDSCSHDEGPLSGGTLDGKVIECPRHGARFDIITGKALRMPATSPIEIYKVRISENGDVEVNLEGGQA